MKSTILIERKYKLIKKIGEGNFGKIFEGININTKQKIAVKLDISNNILLCNEAKIYKLLEKELGIPRMRAFGKAGIFNYLVIDLFDISVEKYFEKYNYTLNKKTILFIINQMVKRVETIHSNNLIHRDIKPENFLIDLKSNTIYLIDYGLTKIYFKKTHINMEKTTSLTGNALFSSFHVNNCYSASRRDDLISVGYILLYLYLGYLPWKNKKNISQIKENILKYQKNIPNFIQEFINYCYTLTFFCNPNYEYLYTLLDNVI